MKGVYLAFVRPVLPEVVLTWHNTAAQLTELTGLPSFNPTGSSNSEFVVNANIRCERVTFALACFSKAPVCSSFSRPSCESRAVAQFIAKK